MDGQKNNYENICFSRFERWVNGEINSPEERIEIVSPPPFSLTDETITVDHKKTYNEASDVDHNQEMKYHRTFCKITFILLCSGIVGVLMWVVSYLPVSGNAGNPDDNEVSTRYISRGLQETGTINMVTDTILDCRAFDIFGEPCVLFIASCCVVILLWIDKSSNSEVQRKRMAEANGRLYEPKNDIILQKVACVLVPLILISGTYIILNGHLSSGGGFSGGAIAGSGLTLYLNALRFEKTPGFFMEKAFHYIMLGALPFYYIARSYSSLTGADHLANGIPLETPGAILSSELIPLLNICVGLVVVCIMYAFYGLFRNCSLYTSPSPRDS